IGAAPMPKDPALCGLAARTQSAPPQFADEANLVCTRHEAALVERFGPTAAKAYRRRLMQHRNVVMSEGPATAHGVGAPPLHGLPAIFTASGSARNRALKTRQAVRVRASALVKGIGTRVLAANALDPTH